jgi:hypothetical protein
MPWLFNEDAALKVKLQGLTVTDANAPNGRPVPVRFRLPETEPANLTYPIIVISHAGWTPASDREHRGFTQLPYAPEGLPTWWNDSGGTNLASDTFAPADSPYRTYFPIPYNLDYQISVYCRFVREHMLPLNIALAGYDKLHPRFGFLDVPQDGTKRTLQLLGGPAPTEAYDENSKRIFRLDYLVRVFSELVPEVVQTVLTTAVNLDLSIYNSETDLTGSALIEAKGILSVGASSAWNVNSI